jgi:hypothetical protein
VSDRPEDVDAAFAEIVADLRREGVGVDVPKDEPAPAPADEEPPPAPAGPPPPGWRGHEADWDWSWGTDEEHYVPPEPPPLPRLRPLTIVALGLLIVGVVLLVVPGIMGLDARIATPVGLAALTCGGGMLLLRVRKTPRTDPDDPNDNGAQI